MQNESTAAPGDKGANTADPPEQNSKEKEAKETPPETAYIIIEDESGNDGTRELLVRVDEDGSEFLIAARNHSDTLDTILKDMCANVYKARGYRQIIELLHERPTWVYDKTGKGEFDYEPGPKPERLYPLPEPEEAEPEEIVIAGWKWVGEGDPKPMPPEFGVFAIIAEEMKKTPNSAQQHPGYVDGRSLTPYCPIHKRQKYKDGKTKRTLEQRYRCPDCALGKPPVEGEPPPNIAALEAARARRMANNPKCETHGVAKRYSGRHKKTDGTVTVYWKCPVEGCQDGKPDKTQRLLQTAPSHTRDEIGPLPECYLDYCVKHGRTKYASGTRARGTLYRCRICVEENKGNPRGGARGGGLAKPDSVENNPKCATCEEHLRVKSSSISGSARVVYYRCKNKCADIGTKSARFELPVESELMCGKHKTPMYKNGVEDGKQKFICPMCRKAGTGKPRGGSSPAAVASKLKKNPKCEGCGGLQRKRGKRRDGKGHYYQCVNQCAASRRTMPEPEELGRLVRAKVTAMNGHHPQDRDDIVQEILQDLLVTRKLTLKDLDDRERMKNYIHSQTRDFQSKYDKENPLSLDAPTNADEDNGQTFADTKPAPEADSDPHQMLEAKEAVEARLRAEAQTGARVTDEEDGGE